MDTRSDNAKRGEIRHARNGRDQKLSARRVARETRREIRRTAAIHTIPTQPAGTETDQEPADKANSPLPAKKPRAVQKRT